MAIINVTTDNTTVVVSNGDKVFINIPGGGTTTIVAAPGANIQNLKIHFVDDTQSDTVIIDLSTFSSYNLHIDVIDYDSTDAVILTSAFNQNVDPTNTDEYNFQYIGANGATFDGFLRAKDNGEKDFTANPPPLIVCFAAGTLIETETGPAPVETLAAGDLVTTRDHDGRPVRWIGRKQFDSLDLMRHPRLKPVRFAAGSLGSGLPYADLVVSPQHRMLVEGWQAELHFGVPEILVPALGFVNGQTVTIDSEAPQVIYYHLLFNQHEIITANGVATESLHCGDMALMAVGDEAQAELNLIFPDAPRLEQRKAARPVTKRIETLALRGQAA